MSLDTLSAEEKELFRGAMNEMAEAAKARGDLGAHGPRRPGGRPGGSSAGRHGSGADECDEQHGRAYPSSQARRHRITAPPRQRMNRSHAAATNSGCSIWATWPLSGSTTT